MKIIPFVIIGMLFFNSALYSQVKKTWIQTDSSKIRIISSKYMGNIETEYYNDTDLIRTTYFHKDNVTIESEMFKLKSSNRKVGLFQNFDDSGNLIFTINHDNNSWYPADSLKYPHTQLLNKMKLKADSIISSIYGNDFLNTYLKWNILESIYFDKNYSQPSFTISWLREDSHKYNPTEFLVIYDLKYNNYYFGKAIRLIIDLDGNILENHSWNTNSTVYNKGIELFSEGSYPKNCIEPEIALKIAKQHGLRESENKTIIIEMNWIPNDPKTGKNSSNGTWKILVSNQKKKVKNKIPKIINQIWVINPWTGEFIRKYKEK